MGSLQGGTLVIVGTPSQQGRYIQRVSEGPGLERLILHWTLILEWPIPDRGTTVLSSHATTEGAIRSLLKRHLRYLGLDPLHTIGRAECGESVGYRSEEEGGEPLSEERTERAARRIGREKSKKSKKSKNSKRKGR